MNMFRILLSTAVLGGLVGCVTPAKQTQALLASPPINLADFHEIKNVDFIDQTSSYCGPATLTMAMRWAGQDVSVDQVAALVYTPGFHGSFQSDMISASRRQGLMAVPIHDLQALLTEVQAGHPVIIFENLSVSWAPVWHYALILGYDLKKQEMIMHSGHDAFYHWDMEKFERSWMLGDYWGLVVLPPGELAASAGELPQVSAVVGLEQIKKYDEAQKSYLKILEKWPNDLVALIGLGNISYQKGNRKEAIHWLQQAVKIHPESQVAQHNLSIAEAL
jgi:tetratricopeptide (TPR) repeat protein